MPGFLPEARLNSKESTWGVMVSGRVIIPKLEMEVVIGRSPRIA